ncbi:hypothetical protein EG327_010593 [Venturia inaequalis]|uniref:MATE efflux family protein n=1 Tax=Venturia inaequalis TaxID=5025 RepID=A0A8H3ZA65_VENIN|nr:hypothetical protein EG327_010593 [Venturia inaequalis]
MDPSAGPRRFSVASSILPPLDDSGKKNDYAIVDEPDETEALLGFSHVHTTFDKESRLLFGYSLPLTLTYLLQYSFNLVTIFVVGHISTDALGAVSLASMTANITGMAVYEGLATSLDTLCAQAYGSGRKELVGLHLQRMALFLFAVTIPIGTLWIFSGPVLAALVPERELAYLAGDYLQIYLLGAPGFALFEAGKRFTQAQGLFNASLIVLLICTPINIALNYLFVFAWGLGISGAAMAVVISNNLLPFFLWIYVCFINPSSLICWGGFSKQAFQNWGPMVKLSLPGIIMVEAEWLAFDILTFSASYLSTAHLAAQSIVMTVCMVMFHIPFSVSVAVSTRLGNLIGSGSLQAAKVASRAYVVIFIVMGLINGTFLTLTRHVLPKAFSHDDEVIKIASQIMPILAAFQLFDATTALVNGMLRSLGRQKIGGFANLIVYYAVAVPLSLFLCFGKPHLELAGLWTGCVVGSALITVSEGAYLCAFNWEQAIDEAKNRDDEPPHMH